MNERLLCKCSNSIIAHKVIAVLKRNAITFRQHDESEAPHAGVYGPTPGIAIYVLEEDYKRALALVKPIIHCQSEHTNPFCPKCGSEDIKRLERSKYVTPLLYLSIFLFITPMVYLYYAKGRESQFMHYLAIIIFISSVVIVILCNRKNYDFKCNRCGKKFNRM